MNLFQSCQKPSFGEHGEEQKQAIWQAFRPAPGNFPTSLVPATGAEKSPLTSLHDLCILNCMVNESPEQLTTVFFALGSPNAAGHLSTPGAWGGFGNGTGAAFRDLGAGDLQAFTRAGACGTDPAPQGRAH